jgi:hypothetical protein
MKSRRRGPSVLLGLDIGCSDDLSPFVDFKCNLSAELLRGVPDCTEAKGSDTLRYIRRFHHLDGLAMQESNDFFRGSSRDEHPKLVFYQDIWISGFCHGGHVWERGQSCTTKHCERTEFPLLNLGHGRDRCDDGNGRMAPDR